MDGYSIYDDPRAQLALQRHLDDLLPWALISKRGTADEEDDNPVLLVCDEKPFQQFILELKQLAKELVPRNIDNACDRLKKVFVDVLTLLAARAPANSARDRKFFSSRET